MILTDRSRKPARRLTFVARCLALLAVGASRAAAQGCAMCYQTAAASAEPGREALRHGILILLIPAVSLFAGIFGLSYRRRNVAR